MDEFDRVIAYVATYGLNVLGGIVLLIIGWIVAGWASRTVHRLMGRARRVDPTLQGFFSSLARYVILAVVIVAVLNQFGVQTASLIAVLGAAGLAIGLALQGTLSNVAAGVMLLIFRPFRVGQYVQAGGQTGTVKDLNLFFTELATPDNVQITIPNGSVWGQAVLNYSHHTTRRADWTLGIGYGNSIEKAVSVVNEVLTAEGRVLKDPAPAIQVQSLGENGVNLFVMAWTNAADLIPTKSDLTRRFKEAFDANDISIPLPHREIHLIGAASDDLPMPRRRQAGTAARRSRLAKSDETSGTTE